MVRVGRRITYYVCECPHKDRNTRVCFSAQLKSICHIDPEVSALCDLLKNFNFYSMLY